MQPDIIVPAIGLILVFLAGPVVLMVDERQRKLLRQVALVTALTRQTDKPADRSIRRGKMRLQRLRDITSSLFRYDPEFAEAYTVPVPLVLLMGCVLGVTAGVFASTALSYQVSIAAGCVSGALATRGLFGLQQDRYTDKLRRQLPDALQFVVSAVRAGFPVAEALRGIVRETPEPTSGQFAQVLNEIAVGRPLNDALLNLYYRTRVAEYAIFAVTLAVQTKTGGQLAETIQTLAETVRERITIAARARALAGEGTVSATILSVLPVITGVALSFIQPGYLEPLFVDPRGRRLFFFAVASLLAGIWMMRRMIKKVVSE